jgi:hypothetical protein
VANGNVGIGTSAPASALEVAGTLPIVRISGTASGVQGMYIASSGAIASGLTYSSTTGESRLRGDQSYVFQTFYAGNAERMRITTAGNVAIGSTGYGNKLDVYLTNTQVALFGGGIGTGNGNYAGIALGYSEPGPIYQKSAIVQAQTGDGSARGTIHILNNNAATAANATLADARLSITAAGNVGIGVTAPAAPLEISQTFSGNISEVLRLSNPGSGANTQAQIKFLAAGTNYGTITGGYGTVAPQTTFDLPVAGNYVWQQASAEKMRLDSSGNLSLNNAASCIITGNTSQSISIFASPTVINGTARLELYGTTAATNAKNAILRGDNVIFTNEDASETMRISDTGNVGIGTSAPTARLSIVPTTNPTSATGGLQTAIGEASDNAAYQLRMGYYLGGTYQGVINVLAGGAGADLLLNPSGGNVGIGTTTPGYKLEVNGSFAATTKSFVIDHPTKPDMKLRYGSLEGPENGVYIRGKLNGKNIIELPDYWTGLVDEDTITVNLTPIGRKQDLFVKDISNNQINIGGTNVYCFYTVFAERKDVEKLVVELNNDN